MNLFGSVFVAAAAVRIGFALDDLPPEQASDRLDGSKVTGELGLARA